MKFLTAILVAVSAQIATAATQTIVLPQSSRSIVLDQAKYVMVPTKTEIVEKPCHGEQYPCYEEVVVSARAMVRVYVGYKDAFPSSEGNESQYSYVEFSPSNFPASEVQKLKEYSKPFDHPFSDYTYKFAKNFVAMSVKSGKFPVQVLDMSKSHLCPVNGETGEQLNPNCQEYLVYKTEYRKGQHVTLTTK